MRNPTQTNASPLIAPAHEEIIHPHYDQKNARGFGLYKLNEESRS